MPELPHEPVPARPGDGRVASGGVFTFAAFGVVIEVRANEPALLERLPAYLPPGWAPAEGAARAHYTLWRHEDGTCTLAIGMVERKRHASAEHALEVMASALDVTVACKTTAGLFVHAGVVGWRGRAVVIPGRSFSGKTTLTKALVEAGATYYSDEYAVFDEAGRVHPYARPLSVRSLDGTSSTRVPVRTLGGEPGREPLPLGLVVSTRHEPGAAWAPEALSLSQAVLRLLDNTVRAKQVPEEAIAVLSRAVEGARALAGPRGEAAEAAQRLLRAWPAA